MHSLHCAMDRNFDKSDERLRTAYDDGNATTMWKLIGTAAEDSFIEYLHMDKTEAKKMRGRGVPQFIKHVEDPGEPRNEIPEKGAAALHRIASRHGTQATRLGHMAANNKKIVQTRKYDQADMESIATVRNKAQIDRTFSNFAKDTNLDNDQEVEWKDKIENVGNDDWRAYAMYKRAET